MSDKYEKINLPIEVDDAQPSKPDFKWATIMIATIAWFLIFSFGVFHIFSNYVVANISIEKEKEIFGNIFEWEFEEKIADYYNFWKKTSEFENYNIYVDNEDSQINAFTFLWWNIVVTKSLLDEAEYEEEVIFVIAHEIGHVQSRHNLKLLARDLPLKMTLFFLGFDINLWITNATDAAINAFSRKAEGDADIIAIKILKKNWLNPYCASKFFEKTAQSPLEFMSSHPANDSRIENIKKAWTWKTDFSDCKKIKKEEKDD